MARQNGVDVSDLDPARAPAAPEAGNRRPGMLIAALSVVALTVAVLQTGVVPVLGVIAHQLNASTVDVSWAVTANLLAAAATTPLIGRLADLYSKRRVLLVVLAVVLAGSLLAALTSSLPLLIVARVLQGTSFSLYPIGVSILREELAPDRLMRAMAVLSGTLGFGGGMGLVVTGLLMRGDAGYHRVFWLTTAFTVLVIVVVLLVVPARPRISTGTVDWAGALGLGIGLSAVLLAITQGSPWGWLSARTTASAVIGAVVLGIWWWWERRCAHPLVSAAMLSRRPILLTNIATVLVGMGLYLSFLGLTDFVQAPVESGYGFGATVLGASVVFLLPGALAGFLTAVASGRYIDRFGARVVLVVGAAAGVAGFVLLAVLHDHPWQVIAATVLANAYISLAYGALPALVVREVDAGETGVATSMNAIARTIGSSIAAAIVAVLLGRSHNTYAPESSFIAIFVLGAVTAAGALVLIIGSHPRLRQLESLDDITDSRALNHEWG
jgi:MFS family permease